MHVLGTWPSLISEQGEQTELAPSLYVPMGQSMQALAVRAPLVGPNLFASQGMQSISAALPDAGMYFPAPQGVQSALLPAPSMSDHVPGGQLVQLPWRLYEPARQSEHNAGEAVPLVVAVLPMGHILHVV